MNNEYCTCYDPKVGFSPFIFMKKLINISVVNQIYIGAPTYSKISNSKQALFFPTSSEMHRAVE